MKYKINLHHKKLLADTLTPVNIYLKVRDVFAGSILLESSDYHSHENSLSMICCDPVASFKISGNKAESIFPDGKRESAEVAPSQAAALLDNFRQAFDAAPAPSFKFSTSGLFGY